MSACAELPSNGPQASAIVEDAAAPLQTGFEIIDLDAQAIGAMNRVPALRLTGAFGAPAPAPQQRIGVGDVVVATLWEAAGGTLFAGTASGSGTHSVALPPQVVDQTGMIIIPYGGSIRALGSTPAELGAAIVAALKDRTVSPQAIVTLAQSGGSTATVAGDVTGAGAVPLNLKGERLLDVIAQAGGIKAPAPQVFVRLTRGGRTAGERLSAILATPSDNVFVRPNDLIYVSSAPQSFTALGAVTHSGELPIDRENFTLAQALGAAGGLVDVQADARGVFMFRFERPEVVRAIRPNSPLLGRAKRIPVIYRLQLTGAAAYFEAKAFAVASEDLIYVSDAPSVEFQKFLAVAHQVVSTARSVASLDPNLF